MALPNPLEAFVWGAGGARKTPEEIARERQIAEALIAQGVDTSPVGHWTEGLARVANAAAGSFRRSRSDDASKQNAADSQGRIAKMLSGAGGQGAPQFPAAPGGSSPVASGLNPTPTAHAAERGRDPSIAGLQIKGGIEETAKALGIDPIDLATAISYETGGTFDPMKAGPTTQWGQHKGFIQFGEPQAKEHGVDWNDPVGSQLGANGAVASYLRKAGVQPGMGLLDIYSAINAGGVGRYNASDANNGGAPGTVADKVNQQMAGHREKALAMFGGAPSTPALAAIERQAPIQVASLDPSAGAAEATAQTARPMPEEYAATGLSPEAWARMNAPDSAAVPAAVSPQAQRVLTAMVDPKSMTGGDPISMQSGSAAPQVSPPLPAQIGQASGAPSGTGAQGEIRKGADGQNYQYAETTGMSGATGSNGWIPVNTDAALQQQVAQALMSSDASLDQVPVMAGGNSGVSQQGQAAAQGINPAIIEALSSPYADAQTRQIAGILLQQHMQANDPGAKLDMEYKRAQIDALQNKGEKLPDSVRALNIRAQQAGLQPGTPEYTQFMISGGSGPQTIINNGSNTSEFVKKSDEAAAKRMDEVVAAGQTAPQTLADMQQLLDLGATIGTGKEAQVKAFLGPYAQSLGINIEGLGEIQAYEAITSRLAPQMRAVGSGSSSDRDVTMFLQSLPNLRNTPEGNQIIGNTMKAVAQNKMNAAEIASKAQRGEISWQDADKQIRELPNPYDLFKGFQKQGAKQTVIDGYTIEQVD